MAITEFAVLAVVQLLLYLAERGASDYYIEPLPFYHVEGSMLYQLLTLLVNVLGLYMFHRISKKMCIDPVLFAVALHCVTEID